MGEQILALNNTPPPLPVPQQNLPAPMPRIGNGGGDDSGDNNSVAPTGTNDGNGSTPADANGGDPDLIITGQWIRLADGSAYQVQQGDTLTSIARRTGTTVDKLIEVNGMNRGLLDGNPFTNGPQTPPGSTVVKPGATSSTPTAGTVPTSGPLEVDVNAARAELDRLMRDSKISEATYTQATQRLDRIDQGKGTREDFEWILKLLPAATPGADRGEGSSVRRLDPNAQPVQPTQPVQPSNSTEPDPITGPIALA